ncbi:hypothetical protein ACS0TY_021310 [Phlomoides rotata]
MGHQPALAPICRPSQHRSRSPPTCNRVECPTYDVVHTGNGFEIRHYNSSVWISTQPIDDISLVSATRTGFFKWQRCCPGKRSPKYQKTIRPTAYISTSISSNNSTFQVVIAAHPSDPYQFVLGMSDGAIHVIKSSEAETKRGGSTPQDNGVLPSITLSSSMNSLPSETPSRYFFKSNTNSFSLLL